MAAALAVAAVGCATPESRIKKYRAAFDSFPPDMQANVRAGRIDIGYPKEAVLIALGEPDRRYMRRTLDGEVEVWAYVGVKTTYDRQRADAETRIYDEKGRRRTASSWIWIDTEHRTEYDRIRVEFRDNRVISFETLDR